MNVVYSLILPSQPPFTISNQTLLHPPCFPAYKFGDCNFFISISCFILLVKLNLRNCPLTRRTLLSFPVKDELPKNAWLVSKIGRLTVGVQYDPQCKFCRILIDSFCRISSSVNYIFMLYC